MALSEEQARVLARLNSSHGGKPNQTDREVCRGLHRCWGLELRWVCSDSPEFDAFCGCPR